MKNNEQGVNLGVVGLMGVVMLLLLPIEGFCQYASLSQAYTVAKVFIAADINWSLGRGPLIDGLDESEIQMRIDDWVSRVRDIDTAVEVTLVTEAEFWKEEFFVFSANPRMYHASSIIVAVSRRTLRVYRLSGFSDLDFNDLVSAFIQPVETREEAASLALFAEVVQRGPISQGVPDSTVLNCSVDREVTSGSISVDTITSIVSSNNAPIDGYGEEDGKFVVHMHRVINSQGVGTIHLISYVVGSSGILDRTAIFLCNFDPNVRQR